MVSVLLGTAIIYPLIPDRDAQSLDVDVRRLVPGPEEITTENTGLKQNEVTTLTSLGLRGKLHGGLQSLSGSGDKHARVLIVVRGLIFSKVSLREPKATNVVYVQDGQSWQMYPPNAPTLRETITLTESKGQYEGLSVQVELLPGKPSTFTWYPPIKRSE